jgi:glycosyltransferase involved in cell wall biosynthesis
VKIVNAEHHPARQAEVIDAASGRSDITIADRFLSRAEQEGVIHACDVFVSLHRAEGFGLMLAEAMAAGKPVIATDYSGNLEFMDRETGFLIPWQHVRIAPGTGPYSGVWAEPDVPAAAEAMVRLAANSALRQEMGARAALAIRDGHSAEARARSLVRELSGLPARPRPTGLPEEGERPQLAERLDLWRQRRAARYAARKRRLARLRLLQATPARSD